ncbi:MAG: LysR family transcriptional regulator, partial [Holophaga sp.]|nr:LysR family transcriptional regulator [Holophaga sp.]
MRTAQLRQLDLNLLVVFAVMAEERSVSRASVRLLLSQPAVSRAMQRLRAMLRDDLLVRTPGGYELTPLGQRVQRELETMLPRLDRLLGGAKFQPDQEAATFRIAVTDNGCQVMCPILCQRFTPPGSQVSFDFVAWHEGSYEDLERGRLDLVLNADEGPMPAPFRSAVLYEEEFQCIVARESGYPEVLTLDQYLSARHVVVGVLGGQQTIPEKRLAAVGRRRQVALRVPYFSAAMASVAGTDLIATTTRRLAEAEHNVSLRAVQPPPELCGFNYLMIWHPRLDTDAAHEWLRQT